MGTIDNIKEVAKLVKDIGNMELYQKILDLQGEVMELTQANHDLQTRVRELDDIVSKAGRMTFRSPFYYLDGDPTPLCPRCWEVDKNAVHYPEPRSTAIGPRYVCLECKRDIVHPRKSHS